jgi:hypothetical protein
LNPCQSTPGRIELPRAGPKLQLSASSMLTCTAYCRFNVTRPAHTSILSAEIRIGIVNLGHPVGMRRKVLVISPRPEPLLWIAVGTDAAISSPCSESITAGDSCLPLSAQPCGVACNACPWSSITDNHHKQPCQTMGKTLPGIDRSQQARLVDGDTG